MLEKRLATLTRGIEALGQAGDLGRPSGLRRVLDGLRLVLRQPGGPAAVQARAADLEACGIFEGTDWATPDSLAPALSRGSLRSSDADTVVLEIVSDLRLLAIALGECAHPEISAEDAREHVMQVLALNADLLFSAPSEAEREQLGRMAHVSRAAMRHIVDQLGYDGVIDQVVEEIWRILRQRPIQVDQVKATITQIAVAHSDPAIATGNGGVGVDRLVSSLFGATEASREDPGVDAYLERLASMDDGALQSEATGFARSMHDTGLVSPYHAVLLRFLRDRGDFLLSEALGLSSTGRESLLCFRDLVDELIDATVHPETAQSIYGLALLLERGVLFEPPVAPGLWRQLALPLSDHAKERLELAFGPAHEARVWLLAGTLSMLGLPLGVGQGDNPTCQSARALSMWAYNDPDYLLQTIAWAARDDEVVMHFEGQTVSSRESGAGLATTLPVDLDAVSLLVVPHLDRIYAEMGRRCADRGDDPHRWVNPEFHGWWSGRGFRINVDVATGKLADLEGFVRDFYAGYHPLHNGNQPLIHPQPAGIAVTDTSGRFIGWHAITVLRVALDPSGTMRVYFYNPNNDSGQDWGDGVVVSTAGNGERFGEASLPFEEFASRLYIFHFDPLELGSGDSVDAAEVSRVIAAVERTWGADRLPGLATD
ncbi:hypothetical protein [Nocardioides panacisoli]|uniref:hypothetical protein n=1 Tax=Nocardioides panacisoli TaxID=627624 RepID=UPI001F2AB7B1|nr:hypothetical protein [Nocardioides panacisoli]